nr:PREDICTED: DEP domain-containing mTOR-interacting protein-like isoform X1 [Lepisosteus oculatus]
MENVGNYVKKKAAERQYKAEVMIAGEQLRLRLHDGKLIKDRRCYLRTYPNCFVAKEAIDWLIAHKEAPDRETAVRLMQHLMAHDIVHHVCDRHSEYKDAKLLYRFRKDDGTSPFNTEVKVFMRGQSLYERLVAGKDSIMKEHEEKGVKYQRAFPGFEMIDWLLHNGEIPNRREGVDLCRTLLDHGIVQHVALRHHFFDSGLLYQFCINFRRRRRLAELLSESENRGAPLGQEEASDSPFTLRKTAPEEGNTSFLSVQPNKEIKLVSAVRRSSTTSLSGGAGGYFSIPPSFNNAAPVKCNPKSVLKKKVTIEELMDAGAPYMRKSITIVGDAVGWGFVVRGESPCHVQAVDPGSPAAAAGIKAGQFVFQVNGVCVLDLDYKTLSRLIMTGPRILVVEVMESLE